MGCDWIDAGSSFVGIVWSFGEIFNGTKYETEEVYECVEEDSGIATAWDSFIDKKHPKMKSLGIKPIIGCYSMPCLYNSTRYSNSCSVVFGYQLISVDATESEDEDGILKYQISSKFRFPKNFSEIVDEFVFDFKAAVSAKSSDEEEESGEEESIWEDVEEDEQYIREIEIVNFLA